MNTVGNSANVINPQPGWQRLDWIVLIGLIVVSILAFLAGLGSFGILDPSDGYYSEGAREMFLAHNWLTPHLNYVWFFDKPIMNYWLISASYAIFGVTEFASRLPAAICGAALVPALYAFMRQFCRRRASLFAALSLLSSPMWLILGHMSLTDMPLSFFIWVALLSFFLALEKNKPHFAWLAYLSMACGLLTKGPLALFLVAMNLGLYVLLSRPSLAQLWSIIKRLHVIPGLLLTLALAAPWYLIVNSETHGVFFQEFFVNQNVNRAMGTVDHKAGPFYYIPVVLGAHFPWTLFLLALGNSWVRPFLRFVQKRGDSPAIRVTVFGVIVALATLGFFSLLPTKLVTYVLPMLPAMAIVSGVTLDRNLRLPASRNGLTMILAALICLIGAAGAGFIAASLFSPETFTLSGKFGTLIQHFMQSGDEPVKYLLVVALIVLSAAGLVLFLCTSANKERKGWRYFFAGAVLAITVAVPTAIVFSFQEKCRDMQDLVRYARINHIDPIMLGHRNPSAMFYLEKQVKFLAGPDDLVTYLKEVKQALPIFFLVHRTTFDDVNRKQSISIVRAKGDWVLGSRQR